MRNCTTHRSFSFSKFIVLFFVLLMIFGIAASVGLTYGGGAACAAAEDLDVEPGKEQYEVIENAVINIVNQYVVPALCIVVSVVMLVLVVITGIKIAGANSEEEKTKAKKRLWGIVAGLIVSFSSIWLIPLLIDMLKNIFVTATPLTTSLIGK